MVRNLPFFESEKARQHLLKAKALQAEGSLEFIWICQLTRQPVRYATNRSFVNRQRNP